MRGRVGLVGRVGQAGRVGRVARAGIAALKRCATFVAAVLLVAQALEVAQGLEAAQGFSPAIAQQPPNPLAAFIKVEAPIVALVHARAIDGTGAPAREDQTIVIRDGNIAAIGGDARTATPSGATIVDLTGKSVMPGLVMLHEHLYYTTGPGVYGQLGVSFSRLYL